MQAVILAGGKGTRLKHLTKTIPKPMIPIGGKPLLEHQVLLCKEYGIEEVIILVNHLKEEIISHFGEGEAFGLSISYFEEPEPLGTVGGIKEIEDQLTGGFLVLYGDVMINMDLQKFIDFHHSHQSECTLALHPNDHPYDSDLVELGKDKRITAFHPKPHKEGVYYRNMVNAGAYIFSKAIFPFLEKGKKADFGREVFPRIFSDIKMYGYNTTEYLKDMGTPDRLEKVEQDYVKGKVERRNLKHRQKAIFLDRDGVINPDKHLIYRQEQMELYPFTSEAIKKINNSDYLCLVATNQSVVARNLVSEDGLRKVHDKLDTLLGNEHAKIDELYYCPHHPDGGFPEENKAYKIVCDCRKPKPGMLLQGAEEFNVDLSKSYFIGDSQRDIEAGLAAGVTTIGLKTGKGLRDTTVFPDYFFHNLKEAVDFIIDEPYAEVYTEIKEAIVSHKKQEPFLLLLGGNSRSGKTTLYTYLKKRLQQDSLTVMGIEMDDWILPKTERPKNAGVFENFQFPRLITDLEKILAGEQVSIHGYARHPERKPIPSTYQYQGQKVIIIEGVVALASESLRNRADLKLFKHIDERELKKRLEQYFTWKGYTGKEIDKQWISRKTSEYDVIDEHIAFADLVV